MIAGAIGEWYTSKDLKELQIQLVKYQQRDGWGHSDLLRLAHPNTRTPGFDAAFRWALGQDPYKGRSVEKYEKGHKSQLKTFRYRATHLPLIEAFEAAKTATVNKRERNPLPSGMGRFNISPRERLDAICEKTDSLPFDRTDCALPMLNALEQKLEVDTFVVYTDSETYVGSTHPVKALEKYRHKMGINAKLIVVGMVANEFSIADPNDGGMLDVVGFDASAPAIMADFARS